VLASASNRTQEISPARPALENFNMTDTRITVSNPFELNYNPESKELTIISTAAVSGVKSEVRLDGPATRALFDLMMVASAKLGGPLGADAPARTVQ